MLRRMEQHLEDPKDLVIFDEVRQAKALVELAEIYRQSRLEEENKQREETWEAHAFAKRRNKNEEKRLQLDEEIEAHARDYLAEIRRLSEERRLRRKEEKKQERELLRDWLD
jgi:hypothetical protein